MKSRKPRTSGSPQVRSIDPSQWNKSRLYVLLEQMRGKKILVVGDLGVDRYTLGAVERISPEAPVPIVRVEREELKLGLAANVADNIRALGGVPYLVGLIGKDRCAQDLRALLRSCRISPDHMVVDPKRRTVLKERIVSERQQLLRVDYEDQGAVSAASEDRLLARLRQLIRKCDGVILQDYAKGVVTSGLARQVFQVADREGKRVAVDPNAKTPARVYRGAGILTPNLMEAEKLSGITIRDLPSLVEAGWAILRATSADHVILTRGKDGIALFNAGNRPVTLIPTYVREVYDVSGAGDTVISVLSLALAAGATLEEAAILGNLAAGVEVGKRGTATVSPEEVVAALEFFSVL